MDCAVPTSIVGGMFGATVRALYIASRGSISAAAASVGQGRDSNPGVQGCWGRGSFVGFVLHRILLFVRYDILLCRRCSVRKSRRR